MSSIVPVLLTSNKPDKKGEHLLKLRIYHNQKIQYANVFDFKVMQTFWNDKRRRVKPNQLYDNYAEMNTIIANKTNEARRVMEDIINQHPDIPAIELRDRIVQVLSDDDINVTPTNCFICYGEEWCQSKRDDEDISHSYADLIDMRIGYLKDFIQKEHLSFYEMLQPSFIDDLTDFIDYLQTDRDLSDNSIYLVVSTLKQIWNDAINTRSIKNLPINRTTDPFYKFNPVKRGKSKKKIALTLSEIKKLEQTEIKSSDHENVRHARNIFLLSFYTGGMRFFDVLKLRWEEIIFEDEGTGIIEFVPWKTKGDKQGIKRDPITKKGVNILKEYYSGQDEGYVFPWWDEKEIDINDLQRVKRFRVNSNSNLNHHLDKIVKRAGIEKNVTFHVARHSSSRLLKESGMSVKDIQAVLGHSDVETTKVYLEEIVAVDNTDKRDEILSALDG